MQEETVPQETPGESGTEEGQPQVIPPSSPAVEDAAAQKTRELEEQNRELQSRLTRQGRELAEMRRAGQPAVGKKTIPAEAFFTDPATATTEIVSTVLAEYEARQEQKRQAERFLEDRAAERGVTSRRLLELNERLRYAQENNPEEYVEILASLAKSNDTQAEIQKAATTAVDTAKRNARAVTAQGSGTQVTPPGKSEDEMSVAELREHLAKKYGEVSP